GGTRRRLPARDGGKEEPTDSDDERRHGALQDEPAPDVVQPHRLRGCAVAGEDRAGHAGREGGEDPDEAVGDVAGTKPAERERSRSATTGADLALPPARFRGGGEARPMHLSSSE